MDEELERRRRGAEGSQPRPVAIEVAAFVIPIAMVTWWGWESGKIFVATIGDENDPLNCEDPDRKIDAALRTLFRVVAP